MYFLLNLCLKKLINESFAQKVKKYNDLVSELREKAIEDHENKNIIADFHGLKKEIFNFVPPPPPFYHLFIRIFL